MPKIPFPRHYKPMLASIRSVPFNDPAWQYEVKWNGYRMLGYIDNGKACLRSRNDNDYTHRFRMVADELEKWQHDLVIDGEMVVLTDNGVSHFNSLENWNSPADGQLATTYSIYYSWMGKHY